MVQMQKSKGSCVQVAGITALLCCCLGVVCGLVHSHGFSSHVMGAAANVDTHNLLCGILILLLGVLGLMVLVVQLGGLFYLGISAFVIFVRSTLRLN